MAAAICRLGYITLRCTSRIPVRREILPPKPRCRQFHITSLRRAEDDFEEDPSTSKPTRTPFVFSLDDLDSESRAAYNSAPAEEQEAYREDMKKTHDYMTSPEVEQDIASVVAIAAHEFSEESPHVEMNIPRIKPGLMSMGEVEEQDSGEDEEFEGDDITSLGHGELEQHREMREYARIMAWEMPLLSKLAKPFTPPSLDAPLRFRYTTYMGETHPAQKKIVLEFCTRDLPSLTPAQRTKLIKLVGPRYNPETDIVKMSSEMFETQAQNKRYLGDLVDTLLAEARDEKDMFEDVPLDFRHHRFRKRVEFPEEWKLGKERREQLEVDRRERAVAEGVREEQGRVVVGARIIEEAMRALPVRDESRVLVDAQQGRKGKAKGKVRALR